MGLLPPVILGALLIVAFALSSLQRLALDSHTGPMPARQIAYQMRTHHQGAVAKKQADPSLDTVIDALNDGDFLFLSCIQGKSVATVMMTVTGIEEIPSLLIQPAQVRAVVEELARQSVEAPELGRVGARAWSTSPGNSGVLIAPAPGIGYTDGLIVRTAAGSVPLPEGCAPPFGAPAMITQVLP